MDGRRGSSSMRLNFAGVPDEDIREGIRRIGRIMGGDTGLLGTLTGATSTPAHARGRSGAGEAGADGAVPAVRTGADTGEDEAARPGEEDAPMADVVALPRREEPSSARRRKDR
jgi:hypothetical protein